MAERPAKQRLIEAAFRLFEERGYERTTVDDITEAAGVSRATFFRTFRAKEDVIFPDHEAVLAAIRARLAGATSETAFVALREGAYIVLRHYLDEGDLALTRYRLTRSVPVLRNREIAGTLQYQRMFREFIHRWLGGNDDTALRAEVLAAAVVTTHNYVLRRWLRGLTDDPEAEFAAAMAQTTGLFAEPTSEEADGSIVVFRTTRRLDDVLPALRGVLGVPSQDRPQQ